MRIQMSVFVLVVMFSSVASQAPLPPTENQPNVENAAVKYLRAGAAIRQSYALPPDAALKLEKAMESPLDAEDEKLVAATDDALIEFHHATAIKRCDWVMSTADGPLANTAHRGAIIELVAISGLRARLRFRARDTQGAISDVLAGMAAARHLSLDGSLASVLIAYRLEKKLTGILEGDLSEFSPEQLRDLSDGLDALPSGASLGNAFESEKVRRNDFLGIIQGAKTRDDLIEQFLAKVPMLGSDRALAAGIVDGCGGSVDGFAKCISQQQSFYASWAPRFLLPPEQFESAYKSEIAEASKANPLIRQFTPALPRFRWMEAYRQTRQAMLRSAIAVRLGGPSGANRHLDPYDGNPFSYTPLDGGFRLESRLKEGGTPISVSIVSPGIEPKSH